MDRAPEHRQAFHHPHTSIGAAGHWIRTAGILAPRVIGEFVKDSERRWRLIRLASVTTALVSEGLYTARIHREREERAAESADWRENVVRERRARKANAGPEIG